MKKLLLTSAGFKNPKVGEEFLKLINEPASEIKIIFVPTASITKEELFYVEKSKKELLNIGIDKQNIKILDLDHTISYNEVSAFDVIYVCGGNTFYLLDRIRKTGFDNVIKQFLADGKIYIGVSAGSILLGPNIEIASLGDKDKCGVKDFTGLNLINMAICPHFDKKEYQAVEEFKKKVDYSIIPLTDNQALLILDNEVKIIGD